jgi:Predicted epimerase, PhzC/PhzF homolog
LKPLLHKLLLNEENVNFYIVDVFAESKYAGNQLAVFCGAATQTTVERGKCEFLYS